jgi:uncharacterized DUF497 family protein
MKATRTTSPATVLRLWKPILLQVQFRNGERRVLCAGRTAKGRAIAVVYTVRKGLVRVVTAFPNKRSVREGL